MTRLGDPKTRLGAPEDGKSDGASDGKSKSRHRRAIRQGLAYQGAFEAVVAILIAAGIGQWIDTRFETAPWGLLVGTAVGFASFVLRLLRLGRQLQQLEGESASDSSE